MRVAELWRYPVKGLRGEPLERVEVAAGGIPGDRGVAIIDRRGIVTGRRKQRMPATEATLSAAGEALIEGRSWSSPEAAATVREVAGEGARLTRPIAGHEHDAAQVLLLSDGSVAQLGYDRRRFRPNILIEGAAGPVELDWVGSRVRIGALVLRVDEPCERCVITTIDPETIEIDLEVLKRINAELGGLMGVYCTVIEPATIAVGDPVAVV